MADLRCASPRCRIPGRHLDDCPGEACKGCLPGHAADGSRLCLVDIRRIGDNAGKLATLYGELELVLKAIGNGERSSSKPGSGTPPRDAVVEMRATIRHLLASWCKFIAEERGITLPIGDPDGMAAYVARHAEWLAATEYAGECADELAEHAGRAWGLAYPNGTRIVRLPEPCPTCGGVMLGRHAVQRLPVGFIGPPRRAGQLLALKREQDNQLPSEVFCDTEDGHRWDSTRWRQLDRLVTAKRKVVV